MFTLDYCHFLQVLPRYYPFDIQHTPQGVHTQWLSKYQHL
jgi:hypothetical protein